MSWIIIINFTSKTTNIASTEMLNSAHSFCSPSCLVLVPAVSYGDAWTLRCSWFLSLL